MNEYQTYSQPVAVGQLAAEARGSFVSKVYGHLFGA
jgi:hypothetical protein